MLCQNTEYRNTLHLAECFGHQKGEKVYLLTCFTEIPGISQGHW